mgnify:CR=1 FL=1
MGGRLEREANSNHDIYLNGKNMMKLDITFASDVNLVWIEKRFSIMRVVENRILIKFNNASTPNLTKKVALAN